MAASSDAIACLSVATPTYQELVTSTPLSWQITKTSYLALKNLSWEIKLILSSSL
jgi:hypothetical protein